MSDIRHTRAREGTCWGHPHECEAVVRCSDESADAISFDDETPPNEFSVEVHAEGSGEVSLDTELG